MRPAPEARGSTGQGQITSVVPPAPVEVQPESPPDEDSLLWQAAKIEAQATTTNISFILPPIVAIDLALLP